jgi:hypothetical protein
LGRQEPPLQNKSPFAAFAGSNHNVGFGCVKTFGQNVFPTASFLPPMTLSEQEKFKNENDQLAKENRELMGVVKSLESDCDILVKRYNQLVKLSTDQEAALNDSLSVCSKLVKANESIEAQLAKKLSEQREGLVSTYRGLRKQG